MQMARGGQGVPQREPQRGKAALTTYRRGAAAAGGGGVPGPRHVGRPQPARTAAVVQPLRTGRPRRSALVDLVLRPGRVSCASEWVRAVMYVHANRTHLLFQIH